MMPAMVAARTAPPAHNMIFVWTLICFMVFFIGIMGLGNRNGWR
jgi:hypothetical protein